MFEENQNWQMKLIDNKIALDPNQAGLVNIVIQSSSSLMKEEPSSLKTENTVKTDIFVNGTQEMEVQEDKENQSSTAKKVKRNL